MAKKIDGYCQKHDNQDYLDRGNTVYVNGAPCTGKDPRCTVVVHDDKAERVFTESEVRAMLEDMRNDPLTDELQRSCVIEPIAAKHGIALDPAQR